MAPVADLQSTLIFALNSAIELANIEMVKKSLNCGAIITPESFESLSESEVLDDPDPTEEKILDEIFKLLLKNESDILAANPILIENFIRDDYPSFTKILLENGFDIQLMIMPAVKYFESDILQLLIKSGADLDVRQKEIYDFFSTEDLNKHKKQMNKVKSIIKILIKNGFKDLKPKFFECARQVHQPKRDLTERETFILRRIQELHKENPEQASTEHMKIANKEWRKRINSN